MRNMYDIKPIDAYIKRNQIRETGDTPTLESCKVIGISTYKNETLTFIVMLENKEVFTYIPPTAILLKYESDNKNYKLKDLCYSNCDDFEISINYLKNLDTDLSIYLKESDEWVSGRYLYTIDFINENNLMNLVTIEDKYLAFVPFHKIKFDNIEHVTKSFDKDFKKQRNTYIV